jgi:hypothetical protein
MGLTFQPSATGTRISQLEIGYTGGNALFVPVAGQGLPPARKLSFDPQALQFAAQSVDVPSTNTVSIQNTGDEPIGITGLSVNGPAAGDYTIAQNQCPQAPATLGAGRQLPGGSATNTIGARRQDWAPAGLRRRLRQSSDSSNGRRWRKCRARCAGQSGVRQFQFRALGIEHYAEHLARASRWAAGDLER